jgi:hypothetical protein
MFTAINLNEEKTYVSPKDPDKENPTVFHLGALDTFVKTYIEDKTSLLGQDPTKAGDEVSVSINLASRNALVVRFGLKGIDNLKDPATGQPVVFKTQKTAIGGAPYEFLAHEVFARIPYLLIGELADEILKINTLSGEEIKN